DVLRRAGEPADEEGERHGGDDVVGLRGLPVLQLHAAGARAVEEDALHRALEVDAAAALAEELRHPFVDEAGAAARVGEAFGERLVAPGAEGEGVLDRLEEGELLDPLGGEVRVQLRAGDAPQLLAVGLEEDLEEAAAEARHHPLLEAGALLGAAEAAGGVGGHAARGLQRPQLGERVERAERVVEEAAAVVDAREAVDEAVLSSDDLQPERV